jgi:hypothetical protein
MDQIPVPTGYEEILEKEKLGFKSVVSGLFSICRSQAGLGQFLQTLLVSAIRLLEGSGGSLWIRRETKIELAFETGESREMLPAEDQEGGGNEAALLEKISQVGKPFVAALVRKGTDGKDQRRPIGIYIPIETEGELFGILKVVKYRESNLIYNEEVELLQNLTCLIPFYMNRLQMPKVIGRMEEIGKLFEIDKEIFSSLDSVKIAFTIANLLPDVVKCQRCTVALYEGNKLRIKAITGQDVIEQKSVTIRSLTRILEEAAKRNDSLNLTYESLETMEDGELSEARDEYFEAHPFKTLYVTPIRDEDRNLGVISIETANEENFSQTDITFIKFVSVQAALAIKNARLFQSIPLAAPWQRLLKASEKYGGMPRAKKIFLVVIALALIIAPFIVPVENKISGKCEILPIYRYYARPKTDGVLKSFFVKEGSKVEKGKVVAALDDEPFQKRLREALSQKDVHQANVVKNFGLGQMADYEIESLKLKEAQAEIDFLQSELEKTKVVAEGSGVVITPQPRFWERIGKPLSKGEELIEIGDLSRLKLEVAVDEKDVKFAKAGQGIRFLLNSIPEKSFDVEIKTVREKAEVKETGNFFIVEAELNSLKEPFKPGMKGEARIYAGKAPFGKVYLREMIDWFRMKIFKYF